MAWRGGRPLARAAAAAAAAVLSLAATPLAADARAAGKLRAGAASADVTPPIGTPMFAYTARSRAFGPDNNADALQVLADPDHHLYAKSFVPSNGIHTRLKARAVVLETRQGKFALAQVDLGGLPHAMVQAVAERIRGTGITDERLLLSATHTHAAHGNIWPNTTNSAYGVVGGDLYDQRTFDHTADGIARAILRADARLARARAGVGHARVDDASRNRAREAFDRNVERPATAHDPDLTVVRVDRIDGRPLAVWSNFAIHPTSFGAGNRLFSGDNPGYAARIVERQIGRGAVNVWTNGNEGDISPDGGPARVGEEPVQWVTSSFGSAHLAGDRVARGILRAWRDAGRRLGPTLEIDAKQSFLPFDGTAADGEPVGPVPVLGAGGIVANGLCAPVDGMAGPGQGRKMYLFGAPKLVPDVAPVSIWKLGDLGVVALPSEVTHTMGLRIRDAAKAAAGGEFSRVIMAGLTDGHLSYTATPEEYDGCFYEGAMTLFGRRQGPRYRDFVERLTRSLLTSEPLAGAASEPLAHLPEPRLDTQPRETPQAGTPVDQPGRVVHRFDRARFSWRGGDRALEGQGTWVRLQRLQRQRPGGRWRTVATDDSFADTLYREPGDTYVETFQFGECTPRGRYRFRVTGRALVDGSVRRYRLASRTFRVRALTLEPGPVTVEDGRAIVRATYPDPGPEALTFLPRLVTTGSAKLIVDGRVVRARPDAATGAFTARVPAGATVQFATVRDGCGNRSSGGA